MKSEYYKLSELDREHIDIHQKTFQRLDEIGFDILDEVLSGEIIGDYLIPIRSLLYRILEFNDTLSVMVANSVINTSFPLIRSEFEIVVQLSYMLNNKENIEEKSMLYHYCGIRSQYTNENAQNFNDDIVSSIHFQKIHENVININNNKKLSWYSLHNQKINSFKALCQKTNLGAYYDRLYPHLSSDIHGNACIELNTMCFEDGGKYYLRNFRMFERHFSLMTLHIDFMCRIFLLLKANFEVPNAIIEKIDNLCSSASECITVYWEIKDGPIDPLPQYSF